MQARPLLILGGSKYLILENKFRTIQIVKLVLSKKESIIKFAGDRVQPHL
jgi:hypothetical protein